MSSLTESWFPNFKKPAWMLNAKGNNFVYGAGWNIDGSPNPNAGWSGITFQDPTGGVDPSTYGINTNLPAGYSSQVPGTVPNAAMPGGVSGGAIPTSTADAVQAATAEAGAKAVAPAGGVTPTLTPDQQLAADKMSYQNWQLGLGAALGIGQLGLGAWSLYQAGKQNDFNMGIARENLANSIKSYNTAQDDRVASRYGNQTTDAGKAAMQAEQDKRHLDKSTL